MHITSTRDHNLKLLQQLNFNKHSNTTVFYKGECSLISPAVAANQTGGYWFDLRRVNLKRLYPKAYLLVRIVPNLFILEPVERISELITDKLMDNRPNSGDVWGLSVEFKVRDMSAQLFNKSSPQRKVKSKLFTLDEIREALAVLA